MVWVSWIGMVREALVNLAQETVVLVANQVLYDGYLAQYNFDGRC